MKTNYKKTHVRIFDATGLIFSANPDIDAYDLSRAVLDVIQKQNQTEPDFVRAMRQEYDNNFGSEYITFDRLLDNMRDDIAANGLESLYTIVKRLKDHDFTDEFINHYLDVNVPAVGIRYILEDIIEAKMLLYAAGETRYADITPEPEFDTTGIIKAKQCLECGSMNTIDAGSGAGCCNACGCWIPEYNAAKRLTGE